MPNKSKIKHHKEDAEVVLTNILDYLPCHIYWKDIHSVFKGCNILQAKSAGFSCPKDMIGKTDFDMPWHNDAEAIQKLDAQVIQTKQMITMEETWNQVEKKQILVFLSKKAPLLDKEGNAIGLIGISFDITDRKKIEKDLQQAKEKAEVANQAKSDFISNMEHDLRTPFTGIRGIASLLYETETNSEEKGLLEIMIQSCKQWETVHNRIFDALVVEKNTPLKIEPVSIRKELIEIREMMAATLHLKNLDYTTSEIPEIIDLISTDKMKFRLIISSLISNAIKFTEKGRITVSVSHEMDHCVIKVIDTGIGIPIDKFDYIFEKFTKLSRSNKHASDFQGAGLGLYIAKQYVHQLNGWIEVNSQLGEGSIFIVKLPLNKPD